MVMIASDSFTRTVSGGWGTADTGGLWTTTAGVSNTNGTAGLLSLNAASAVVASRLQGGPGRDLTTSLSVSFDKVPNGGVGGWVLARGRITSNGEYRLKIFLKFDGTVEAFFTRTNAASVETSITTSAVITGLSYVANTVIHATLEVTGRSPTTLNAKIWGNTLADPGASWQLSTTDATPALQSAGHTGLAAILAGSVTNFPIVAKFDDFLVTAPVEQGVPITYVTGSGPVTASGHTYYKDANGPQIVSLIVAIKPGYSSVTAMLASTPFYIAHRGGGVSWPEMSLYAYTHSIIKGYKALELSLARTSDGVWFGLHDATLDRTSGVTGVTASAKTWAQIQTYQILGSTATGDPSQPNRPYMRWEEIIAAYYPSHVIFVDPKAALAFKSELMAMMNALPGTPQNHLICKYFGVEGGTGNTGWAKLAADNGYHRWGYFYQADSANFATYQGRWDILGMDSGADQATWNTMLTYGKPVIGHTISDQTAATSALTKGANGLMVSQTNVIVPT